MPPSKRIAMLLSEKKLQKMNWKEFETICNSKGFEVFKVNMEKSLQSQEPFSVLVLKVTGIIASATFGDIKSQRVLEELENYVAQNPGLIVIDPLPNVKKLLDRYNCYTTIHSTNLHTYNVFTPNFCALRSNDMDTIREDLRKANVTYPFICKPILGQAHEMAIIFNEKCLMDVRTPCVAQSFVKHDAILYKIFIIGDRFCCVERPSLKNFEACDSETIYFDSGDVSRANATSRLTVLDPEDVVTETAVPDNRIMNIISVTLREAFGVELLGVDVIIEKGTGRFAVIDANGYPGYDGYSDYYEALIECIINKFTSAYT